MKIKSTVQYFVA